MTSSINQCLAMLQQVANEIYEREGAGLKLARVNAAMLNLKKVMKEIADEGSDMPPKAA